MNIHNIADIDQQISEIQNGTRDLLQFNKPEHAGVCSAGPILIGALIVCDIARAGVSSGGGIVGVEARALESIALHNYLFPQTIMRVIGFTRDSDGLFRIILTQPYIECLCLATKEEISEMVSVKGFHECMDGNGVNYFSDRLLLEDLHPANVFIESSTGCPICIDCIVKFRKDVVL